MLIKKISVFELKIMSINININCSGWQRDPLSPVNYSFETFVKLLDRKR